MEAYQTISGVNFWISDGILYSIYNPAVPLTLEVAKEFIETGMKISKGKSIPMLADIKLLKSIDIGVRDFILNHENSKFISACGILIESDISRFMGDAIICVNKPSIPVKLFTSEDCARKWLNVYR